MSYIDISVIPISLLFAIYGLAAAVEYGIVTRMLVADNASKRMFTPLWEITNVYLVFGFTALAILFNNALITLSHDLISTLSIALFAMLVRASVGLGIFYMRHGEEVPKGLLWLFALTTYLVPLGFTGAGAYLLTGRPFWQSPLGLIIVSTALLGLLTVGLMITSQAKKSFSIAELLFSVWMLFLGCVLPLSILHNTDSQQNWPVIAVVVIAASGLGLQFSKYLYKSKKIPLIYYSIAAFMAIPPLLAWNNRPFLIAGKQTLAMAFGAQTYASAVVIGLGVMLPLIIFGSWLFLKLLPTSPSA